MFFHHITLLGRTVLYWTGVVKKRREMMKLLQVGDQEIIVLGKNKQFITAAPSTYTSTSSAKLPPRFLFCKNRFLAGPPLSASAFPARHSVVRSVTKRSPKRLKYAAPRLNKENGLFYVEVDPSGDDSWKLEPVIQLLMDGAVGVIPTDTVYALVCDLKNQSAVERLRRIKDIEPSKPLSILCHSLRDIGLYTVGFPRGNDHGQSSIFRAVKHCLPGPYTFILLASKALPKQCMTYGTTTKCVTRKTVGVRIPDDAICQAILSKLDTPLISTSVRCPLKDDWLVDPVIIADTYGPEGIDFIVAGGTRIAEPSTVVDMTGSIPTIIRQGKGPKLDWMVMPDDEENLRNAVLVK